MEHDNPIHKGNLLIKAVGTTSELWHQKYCILYKFGKFARDRIEIFDDADLANRRLIRTISLQGFIEIISRSSTQFIIKTKKCNHEFDALTTSSMNEWLQALQSVVFPDDCSKMTSIEEYNELYCPSGEGIFKVKLSSSPASLRCGLEAKPYVLILSNNSAQLRNCDDNELLFSWPYCFIRRYGYKNGKFTFEAGRKCTSGEGIFYFEYPDQHTIFRCFASKIKSMKKSSNETLPTILGKDNSLNMETRSRSPMLLSPNTSNLVNETERNISYKSQEIGDSITTKLNCIPRPIPSKPPRKIINAKADNSKKFYNTVNKYEEITDRIDAWKTMGISNVNHVEPGSEEPEEYYMSWGQVEKMPKIIPKPIHAPKVINETSNGEDYDQLNFFGSTIKLNNSSTYNRVTISAVDSLSPNSSSFNVYDEVGIGSVLNDKIANDTLIHEHTSSKKTRSHVDHQFQNNEPYAQINKQKWV